MAKVEAELYVRAEGGRIGAAELLADPALRARIDLAGDPLGGLTLSDGVRDVRLDDTINFIVQAFLYEAPAALAAGKGYEYRMRLSPGLLGILVSDGIATVIDDNSDRIDVPVDDLLAALAEARATYEKLAAADAPG